MKILIDLTSLADNFSGIERFALSITQELVKHREHDYILVFKNQVHEAFRGHRTNVKKMVLKGKNKLIFNQFILPSKLWCVRADYYLFLAFPAPFFFCSEKSISTIHDMGCWDCPKTNTKKMIAYFRIMYRKAVAGQKKIITISEFSKSRIMDILNVNPKDIMIIYAGLSEQFRSYEYSELKAAQVRAELQMPQRYILCLSTIEPRKNMRILIEAYEKMRYNKEVVPELVLVGRKGWMTDNLLSGISEETKAHIHLTGFVGDEALPYVYHDAELFVFPSLYEGFGIPPLEALACGTSVLSSDAASMPEIMGEQAVYFKNGDMEDLICKLRQVLSNPHPVDVAELVRKYDWKKEAEKLLRMLEKP